MNGHPEARSHFDDVRRFLVDGLAAESVDEMFREDPNLQGPRADYLAFDRQLIIELKNLEDDRHERVQAVLNKWQPMFGVAFGTVSLDQMLRRNPYGEQIYRELVDAALASVEPAYKKANRQVRAMRERFALPDAPGLLIFAVDDVFFFDPVALNYALARVVAKKRPDGTLRFTEVDMILLLTAAHVYVANGVEHRPVMYWMVPQSTRRAGLQDMATLLVQKWAETLGQPLVWIDSKAADAMKIVAKTQPVFSMY